MADVTQILSQIESGDPLAAAQLLPLVYANYVNWPQPSWQPGQTLQATSLVHEAYIRLVGVEKAQHWIRRVKVTAARNLDRHGAFQTHIACP